MRILVIEDNADIAITLGDYLEDRGRGGLRRGRQHWAGAPGGGQRLRRDRAGPEPAPGWTASECPPAAQRGGVQTGDALTARDLLENKLAGFDSGADDYLIAICVAGVDVRLNGWRSAAGVPQADPQRRRELGPTSTRWRSGREGKLLQLNPTASKILQSLMKPRRRW